MMLCGWTWAVGRLGGMRLDGSRDGGTVGSQDSGGGGAAGEALAGRCTLPSSGPAAALAAPLAAGITGAAGRKEQGARVRGEGRGRLERDQTGAPGGTPALPSPGAPCGKPRWGAQLSSRDLRRVWGPLSEPQFPYLYGNRHDLVLIPLVV